LLKEKCPWHLDGNHTTEQCYQLRRALKDTPEPRHPHDKKGKKKADKGNDDFQEPDKTVNILFGGLPNRRAQKATRREVLSIEPAVLTPLRWSDVPITFSRADQWTSFSEPGRFPLVLKPVVAGSRLNKVLIDGLEEARCVALVQSARYLEGIRCYHDRNVKERSFNVGDLVLCRIQNMEGLHQLSSP
jgi:hypothetical protein